MTEKDKQSKLERRWLRFSLRTFLIVVTIFCVCFGWYLYQVEKQREAVRWVRANGGTVLFDYEFDENGDLIDDSQLSVPKWLLDMLGVDYFYTVTHVDGSQTDLRDVTPLASLKSLKGLNLADTQVSNVAPLAGLTNLEHLFLFKTQVSDITPLAGLMKLKHLGLFQTPVSDVTPLAGLVKLEDLNLSDSQVSDVAALAGLTNLKILHLSFTQVRDEDIEKLKLALPNCGIID